MIPSRKAILCVVDPETGKIYTIKPSLKDGSAIIPVSVDTLSVAEPEIRKILREELRREITSGDVAVTELTNAILKAIRDRLPSALTEAGNLKAAVVEDAVNLAKSSQLPSTLTAAGNLKVSVEESSIKQPVDIQDHWVESVVLLPSGARTASGSTADIDVGRFICGEICIDITAVSGTAPTLDVYIEGKDQYTGKYKVLFSHTGLNTVQTIWDTITLLAFRYLRVRWVISGTSPSFTFSVSGEFKS